MSGRSGRGWFHGAWVRRVVQLAFLSLFVGMVLATRLQAGSQPKAWLKAFFWIDPLVLLLTWIGAHAVPVVLWSAVGLLLLTVIFGRFFCGWICPLGTLHAIAGRVLYRVWPDRKRREHWSAWQRSKYYVLAGGLAAAILGADWITVFDPLVFLYRSLATGVLPALQWMVEEGATTIFQVDPGVGSWRLTQLTEPPYQFLRERLFGVQHQAFVGGGLILALFVGTLLLNRYRRRFWCRYVCPLGALLGVFAWRPWLRRQTAESCNQCDLCAHACHGASGGTPGGDWKAAECFVCLSCTEGCRRDSLGFTFGGPWRSQPAVGSIDLSKRALLAGGLGGVAALAGMRAVPQASPLRRGIQARGLVFEADLIRPPGARDEREFLQRCTACGMCMKICPTGGLQPAWWEAGLEGLWTPHLVPRLGYCDYECNLCGQVCPTEAIVPLPVEKKRETRIGLAAFDVVRCIPHAYGRDCIVCEEHCPVPDKAIYTLEVEVTDRNGEKKTLKQPHVDPEKCIGCGVCESVCPLRDRPGIRVFSANETRNNQNQPIPKDDTPYG